MRKTKAQLEREIKELYAAMTALEKTARRQQRIIDGLRHENDHEDELYPAVLAQMRLDTLDLMRQRDQYRNRALALIRKTYRRIDEMWIKSVSMLVKIVALQQENKSLKVKLTELMSKPQQ